MYAEAGLHFIQKILRVKKLLNVIAQFFSKMIDYDTNLGLHTVC